MSYQTKTKTIMDKAQAEQYLAKQEKNFAFITERLRIQSEPNYQRYRLECVGYYKISERKGEKKMIEISERQYNAIELDIIQEKIDLTKAYINKLV